MTFVVPVLGSVMAREANSNKFSFFSVTRPCKRRNDTSGAGRSSRKRSTIDSKSRLPKQPDNPVYRARWRNKPDAEANEALKQKYSWCHVPEIVSVGFSWGKSLPSGVFRITVTVLLL